MSATRISGTVPTGLTIVKVAVTVTVSGPAHTFSSSSRTGSLAAADSVDEVEPSSLSLPDDDACGSSDASDAMVEVGVGDADTLDGDKTGVLPDAPLS